MRPRIRTILILFVAISITILGMSVQEASAAASSPQSGSARLRSDSSRFQEVDHSDGRPSFVFLDLPVSKFSSESLAQGRARDFWKRYGDAFGLTDASTQLKLIAQTTDALGVTTIKYQQRYRGLDVASRQLVLHIKGSTVTGVNGDFVPAIDVSTTSSVSASEAQDHARARYARAGGRNAPVKPQLLVYVDGVQRAHLAWRVLTTTWRPTGLYLSFVDAHDGSILSTRNDLHALEDRQVYDNANDVDCFSDPPIADDGLCNLPGSQVRAEGDPATGDADVNGAYDNSGTVWSYYNTTFGRDSFDNAGETIKSTVHFGVALNNAFWCNSDCVATFTTSSGEQMIYGDGDGTNFSHFAEDPDVVAHELTHGVIGHTANFDYLGQSGALDESYADSFAFFVSGGDPVLGEASCLVCTGGAGARDLSDPSQDLGEADPSTMAGYVTTVDDNSGVHTNSLIPSHAAYLLASGGSYAITVAKTEKIYYRALTTYLTSTSDFVDNATALYAAATDLYGTNSAEEQAVVASQRDVGISIPVTITAPGGGDVLKGGAATSIAWNGAGTAGSSYMVDYSTATGSSTYQQGFESTSLPSGWATIGGGSAWAPTTSDFWSGARSLRAATIGDGGRSSIGFTRTLTSPGTLSFLFRVSSEDGFDFFSFYVDGNLKVVASGQASSADWFTVSVPVAKGTHTFAFLYEKDPEGGSDGSDTAWIDDLTLTNTPTLTWHSITSGTAVDASSQAWTPPATSGSTYRVRVRIVGVTSNAVGEAITGPFTVDASGPSVSFTGSVLNKTQTSRTIAVIWSASDSLSGVTTYDLQERHQYLNGGTLSGYSYLAQLTTKNSLTLTFPTVDRGYTICFRVTARDGVGNASASERCTSLPLDDRSFPLNSGWARGTSSAYYEGTYTVSKTLNSKLGITGVRFRTLVLVAATCSGCGTVGIYRGSTLLKKVSLSASTTHHKVMFTIVSYSTLSSSTSITIKVLTSGKPVYFDGLGFNTRA